METRSSIDCKLCQPRQHSIFCKLSDKELPYLRDYKTTKNYRKHEIIFHEGDKPQGLFCVFSGMIKIFKTSENGKEQIVRLAQSGDVLGYRAFFSGETYSATAQSVTDVMICFIEREGISGILKNSPEIIYSLLKKVFSELREAEGKFQDLLEKNVEERLRHFLLMFIKDMRTKKIDLPLSREEIASLIGARSETVIRVFSSWKTEGLLSIHAKSLTVLKPSYFLS